VAQGIGLEFKLYYHKKFFSVTKMLAFPVSLAAMPGTVTQTLLIRRL
jgi:hypothetical protein